MDRDDRLNDNRPADGPAGQGSFEDAAGAYVLDALDEAERAEFEAFLRDDPEARAEVAELRPVIDLLPLALDDRDLPQPSAGLRDRILRAAREETSSSPSGDVGGSPPPVAQVREPTRRAVPPADRGAGASYGTILPFVRRIGVERLVAGLLALVAAGAIIWGITLQNRLNDTENDLNSVRDELAAIQGDGEGVVQAVVYTLDPTEGGPETANGIVSMQAEGSTEATMTALGMPPTEEGRVYQLWFLNLDDAGAIEGAPRPSVTFQIGADGAVIVEDVPVDGPFEAVAITNEPAGGSAAPTTDPIMFGTRGIAAG